LGQNDTGFNLSSIVDVNEKDAEGNTYLFYAASYGHAELAQALVEHGADIEIAGKEGLTPLMIAAGNGRLGVVQYLIDAGASIDHQDVNDDDALVHAAEANHLDVVNELILTNKISGERMGIAMICAAAKFHQEIAELLILNQANLFALLEGDPVWRWTQGETLNIINNAIANKIKVGDITAEDLANIAKIKKEALDSWKDADGNGFAHLAVQMPDNKQDQAVKLIKALKGAGANLDVENGQGLTPLMLAAQNGKGEVVSTLIDAGVDVNKKNSGGYTALMFAAAAGNIDILARLLVAKPDCNVVDAEGKTALTWAVTKNQLEIVKALLAAGAGKELGEYTPLAWAVFTQKDDSVTKALLEKEANPLAPTVFKNANDETKKLLGAAIITRIEQDKLPTEDEIEELIALVPANEILTWRATDGKTMFDMVFTLLGTKENAKLAQSLITHLLGDKDSDDVLGEMLKWEDGSGGTMFDALADLAKTEEKVAQDLAKHMLAGKSAEDIDEMIKKVSGKKATAAFLTAQKSALVKDPLQQSLATVKTQLEKLKGGLSKLQDAVEKLRGSLA
jgi:ankyrin repeat protein